MQVPNHVREHIETVAKHEQEFLERRSPAERLGDLTAAIVGSLSMAGFHLIIYGRFCAISEASCCESVRLG
jgi:hypothetical protein